VPHIVWFALVWFVAPPASLNHCAPRGVGLQNYMNQEEAMKRIYDALEAADTGLSAGIDVDTDLTGDGKLDSLQIMNFLFELEEALGVKIEEIYEEYDDYKVSSLVNILMRY
jgi:acyl carrier protein